MKIKKIITAVLSAGLLSLCLIPEFRAAAENYDNVMIDSLSKYESFYAHLNGAQYKDNYYFCCGKSILLYTNEMKNCGRVPELLVKGCVEQFFIDGGYIVYRSGSEIHVMDLDAGTDNAVAKKVTNIEGFDGTLITFNRKKTASPVTIDVFGTEVENTEAVLPAFSTDTAKVSRSVVFKSEGQIFAGVKYSGGKYGIYSYNGESFVLLEDKLSVDTTVYYMFNEKAYFLKTKTKGNSVLYELTDKGLVKAGSCNLSDVLERKYGKKTFYTDENYLILFFDNYDKKKDCKGDWEYYIFNNKFELLNKFEFDGDTNRIYDADITLEIKNGVLYIDYSRWDYAELMDEYPDCTEDSFYTGLKNYYENLSESAKEYINQTDNEYKWKKRFSTIKLEKNTSLLSDIVNFGKTKKGKPLTWKVIDEKEDSVLLFSMKAIKRGVIIADIDYNDGYWKLSTARKWLNNTFYNNYFDASDKEYIIQSTIKNSWIETEGAYDDKATGNLKSTDDRFFFLSAKELINYSAKLPDIKDEFWLRDSCSGDGSVYAGPSEDNNTRYSYQSGEGDDSTISYYPAVWVKKDAFKK